MHQTPEQQATDTATPPFVLSTLVHLGTDIAQLVAANPNAEPDLLRQLALSKDAETRKAVTTNPNTPTEVLLELAQEFPRQFIDNSVFPFLLLENPNFVVEISYWTLLKLLRLYNLPDFFLSAVAKHHNFEVLYLVAKHHQTPESALLEMARRSQYDVRLGLSIAQRENVSESVLATLAQYSAIAVRLYLAKHHTTPHSILEILAETSEPNLSFRQEIHQKIAKNPNTPLALVEKLVSQNDKKVKQAIATRADLPKHILIELANDYRIHTMNFLAQNLHISANVLIELASHPELRVRQMVASHPNTPENILAEAAKSAELYYHVAQNPSASANLLDDLAQHQQNQVWGAIAVNPSTPGYVLERIAQNRTHDLLIAQHPNATPQLLQQVLWRLAIDERFSVRKYVAKHPHTPMHILIAWVRKEPLLRPWIAQNPNIQPQILEILARDVSVQVRIAVASNPNTPNHLLEQLAKDREVEVRQTVASNSNSPVHVLEMLVKDWQCSTFVAQNPNTPTQVLEYLTRLSGFNWLLMVHRNTTVEMRQRLLITLAKSRLDSDRLYAARHPNTPTEVLVELAMDKNLEVRDAALQCLKKHTI
jgi:Leucine rich repeat variant